MTILRRPRGEQNAANLSFLPTAAEVVARARSDLRLGLPVILSENGEGLAVLAIETLTEARHAAALASGPAAVVLTPERARALGLSPTGAGTALAASGLPLATLRALADPSTETALALPRDGQAQSACPLHLAALALAKSAQVLPALLTVALADASAFAADHGLLHLPASAVEMARLASPDHTPVSAARLPMAISTAGRVHVFRPGDNGAEHYAIEVGARPNPAEPVLVRLHSACFTGDVLGSLKCDCGPQLQAAMAAMAAEGSGVVLYLNQEGRGIGLANKMRAYALQDRGMDTVEANHALGFADDERDFRIGARLLAGMGLTRVRLMTNNPAKVAMLESCGITVVERVPLHVGKTAQNAAYLATKALKSGHLLT
jgi:GTP cyclohydrolase II